MCELTKDELATLMQECAFNTFITELIDRLAKVAIKTKEKEVLDMGARHYGVVVVNFCDIDGKHKVEYVSCDSKNQWALTCGRAYEHFKKLLDDGEILDFEVNARVTETSR